ncbi:MAG: carbamoyltransferase HypF, partial [Armatimonadetes bacterium]|nr:carbamoyltransferase HypF [Armatimonadota bacterium]
DEEAARRLGHIADHFVSHDRPIHLACDDSVARVYHGMPMIVRRARGYVPRPIDIGMEMPRILACGGDLKNTFCLTKGKLALVSQHLGDLENVPTMDRYREVVEHFCRFFDVTPEIIAHDLHPDYRSTRFAQSLGVEKMVGVQHHHAHIASCMAENGVSEPVIGIAFDGTGYGPDERIWGGEFLVADYEDFQRAAHLAYVPIPGGEAAIRRPGRMALAYLLQTFGSAGENMDIVPGVSADEAYAVGLQIERGLNAPLTSSMGRLFDAVSALLGVCGEVTYEGQAAIELEAASAGPTDETYPWRLLEDPSGGFEIDVRPMIAEIVEDVRRGVSLGTVSSRFHSTIADIAVKTCCEIQDAGGPSKVALSGGVFQNALLVGMVIGGLENQGFEVFRHSKVPCNDGCISLGQAAVAARRFAR